MKYAFLFYQSKADLAQPGSPEHGSLRGEWIAYINSMAEAGIMRGGAELHPPDLATTVRLAGGKRQVQDGPFADTKEQLGGLVIIEVPDLDAALEWAARAPAATSGCVEVRPTLPESED